VIKRKIVGESKMNRKENVERRKMSEKTMRKRKIKKKK